MESGGPLDAVVIGAGHNGLVAAAYLARAGLSVEVYERREMVGGACVTEELFPGVRASPGAYSLSLLRNRIIEELDLRRHGLHVEPHEPVSFAPLPDERRLITWSDVDRTHRQIEEDWSRADADAYRVWAQRWDELAERARPLMLEDAPRERWIEAVGQQVVEGSMLDELVAIPSQEIQATLATAGLIGELAGPADPGTAFVGFYHDLGEATASGAWGYPRGGMGAVTQALRAAAEAAGARIRTAASVERVLTEDGRAVGVVLADGSEIRARAVLSNADPVRTAALAGVPAPPGWSQRSPVVKVMVLLDRLPSFPAWPDGDAWSGTTTIAFSLEDLERTADDARAGRMPTTPFMEVACHSATDEALEAGGRHVASMFCQCFPSDVQADAAAKVAIDRFAQVCPDFPDCVVDVLALGPRELEERFGLTGGHIFHGDMLGGQRFEGRPGPRRFGGIDGLYLAGSGARPGGAVTGAPGYLAASAVLQDAATPAAL
jgi:phytoene dehydrogenase-like protein